MFHIPKKLLAVLVPLALVVALAVPLAMAFSVTSASAAVPCTANVLCSGGGAGPRIRDDRGASGISHDHEEVKIGISMLVGLLALAFAALPVVVGAVGSMGVGGVQACSRR